MAYCKNCGQEHKDNAKFCTNCGSAVEDKSKTTTNEHAPYNAQDNKSEENKDTKTGFNERLHEKIDISNNKVYSYFAYLWILVLIPILAAPNSKFAKFHSNQGLVLFLSSILYSIASRIANVVISFILTPSLPWISAILKVVLALPHIGFLVLIIIGLVNVSNGEFKKLPVIGDIDLLK